jgi:hypothetical protein
MKARHLRVRKTIDEYEVQVLDENRKRVEAEVYYTDDKADAFNTLIAMARSYRQQGCTVHATV